MLSLRDEYIHSMAPENILAILQKPWVTKNQSITSATTNTNDLVEPDLAYTQTGENTAGTNAFADIDFGAKTHRILDLGGGKFDVNIHYMKQRKAELLVWDPFNRSREHNSEIQTAVMHKKVDAATSMSVLNVIPELAARLAHITTLKSALVVGGKGYFKIWPGENELKGSYLPLETPSEYQANAYADRFYREIEVVFGEGNVHIDQNVPNLIIAEKVSEDNTALSEIVALQKKSVNDLPYFKDKQSQSHQRLYTHQMRLFSINKSLLRKWEDDFLEQHRHEDPILQSEYDKKFALMVI